MRWMTYNIKLGLLSGLEPVIRIVDRWRPDFLALQEVGSNWRAGPRGDTTRRMAVQTGLEHCHFVPTISHTGACRYGHAVLSRWPLRNLETTEFPRSIDEQRTALTGEVVTPEGPVGFLATHLSHLREERRNQGPMFADLAHRLVSASRPSVILGDLNEPLDEAESWLRDLRETYDDAARIAPDPTFENPEPTQRIDYLLINGHRWNWATVPSEPEASDHRPVVADFRNGSDQFSAS